MSRKASKILGLSNRHATMGAGSSDKFPTILEHGLDSNINSAGEIDNVMGELRAGPKSIFACMSPDEKILLAMEQLRTRILKEDNNIQNFHVQRLDNHI